MTTLTNLEKKRLEKALVMGGGWVLSFSNRTFAEFFHDALGIDIEAPRYLRATGSKAHRMRAFWEIANAKDVLRVLALLVEGWDVYADGCIGADKATVEAITARIRQDCLQSTV